MINIKLTVKQECIVHATSASVLALSILFLLYIVWFVIPPQHPSDWIWSIIVTLVVVIQIPGLIWSYRQIYKRLSAELHSNQKDA